MQFTAPYHNDKVILYTTFWFFFVLSFVQFHFFSYYVFLQDTTLVPSFYHQQWAPEYPDFVHFRYDGTSYQIRLRQHRQKVYFAEGLNQFRKDLAIYESITIHFLVHQTCRRPRMISREHQTCRRPRMISREHIWTIEITQSMLGAP